MSNVMECSKTHKVKHSTDVNRVSGHSVRFSIKGGFLKKRSPSQAMSSPEIKKMLMQLMKAFTVIYLQVAVILLSK